MSLVFIAFLIEGILCYIFRSSIAPAGRLEMVSLFLLTVNFVIALLYLNHRYRDYDGKVFPFFALSLLLKCFLIIWDYYGTDIFILPNSHSDSESFHRGAVQFMKYGGPAENYSYVVGWIYSLFSVQRMTAQYFNAILSLLGIDILERILCLAGISKESRKITLILAALLPNYLIISSILIRECLISVILCASLYMFMRWWKNNRDILFLCLAFGCVFLACSFHAGSISVAIGYSLVLILTRHDANNNRVLNLSFRSVFFALIFFMAFSFTFEALSDSILKRFGGMEMEHIETYIDEHHLYGGAATGRSSKFSAGIPGYTGVGGIVINSPIRLFYFLWVPMPWMFRSIGDLIAFFGSSLFYGGIVLLSFCLLIKKKTENKALITSILIIALIGALVFSWGIDSAGSALRHREKFFFIYLLLFALLCNAQEKRQDSKEKMHS